jgi:hypothetical protein
MRIRTRHVITQLAAALAWLLVCVTALMLWIGISTHARAQSPRASVSQNIAQNSRGPAAFPVEAPTRQMLASSSTACSDYKRQIEQLQTIIALQNQKMALLSKK